MPPPTVAEIAAHFPELEIIELLGAGGMGAVYKARQPQLDRFVALKILSHDLAKDPAFVERFNREAKMLARLSHPNIVGVHDFGTAGPYCYLMMEYVDGVNLRQAMRAGRFKPVESLAMVQHICSALKFAHEEGILHRDIKPENVLIDSKGRVKIADFGIAKLLGENQRSDVTLTIQGSVLGSPHYMAPEQFETPGDIDQRADIYSLGVVFYELLTGELPIGRFALPSEKAEMDARIDQIVMRTLEKERQARFQTAEEVSTSVEAVAKNPQAPAPAANDDSGTARFSVLSAILTGLSLVLGAFVAVMLSVEGIMIVAVLVVFGLPAAIAAVTGIVLGAQALGTIRKSGGTMDGVGLAIFAVVAWPVVCMAVLVMFFMYVPMPGTGGIGMPLAMLLTGVPLLLAVFVLIRGVRRWARGVERNDGQRLFPGLTGTVMATLGLTILGPVLAVVLPLMFGPSHDPFEEDRMTMTNELVEFESSASDTIWHVGRPEINVPIRLQPGLRANFLLVERNEKGGTNITTIGQINADFSKIVMIKVGGLKDVGSAVGDAPELGATLSSGGQYFQVSTGTDLRGWKFFKARQEVLTLSVGERREFELANRPGTEKTLSEVMHLVVETTPLNR